MPDSEVTNLLKRLQRVETEITIDLRNRQEEARKARAWLNSISPEDIQNFKELAPLIQAIVEYSEEDIIANQHNESQNINKVVAQLRAYATETLSYFEEHLC